MGPYCKYCGTRCFVHDARQAGHLLATCAKGQENDRQVCGYSYDEMQAEQDRKLTDAIAAKRAMSKGCHRGCPDGECYCAEPTYADMNEVCSGCGGHDGDCYCGED